jgi:hypothetical protein
VSIKEQMNDLTSTKGEGNWRPTVEYDHTGGVLTSVPRPATGSEPDQAAVFSDLDLDPSAWTITSYRRSKWQRFDGEWLEAFRANFVPTRRDRSPIEDLLAEVKKYKPGKILPATGDGAFQQPVGDMQLGKEGSAHTVARFLSSIDYHLANYKEFSKKGAYGLVVLPQLGDCIEHITGHYAMQTFSVELTLTEQIRLYRRLLLKQIKAYAPHAQEIWIPIAPGNHDEAIRGGGKAITRFSDSFAIDAASAVQDALSENDAFSHVKFFYPKGEELTVTLDVKGTICTYTHGHQWGTNGKHMGWWAKAAHGQQDHGQSKLLFYGHFHHLNIQREGAKTSFGIPAYDSGSDWWTLRTGQVAPPAGISLTTMDGHWNNLNIYTDE